MRRRPEFVLTAAMVLTLFLCLNAQDRGELRFMRENRRLSAQIDSLNQIIASLRSGDSGDELWQRLRGLDFEAPEEGAITAFGDEPALDAAIRAQLPVIFPGGVSYNESVAVRARSYMKNSRSMLSWAFARMDYWRPFFEKTFKEAGVPVEYAALAVVESAVSAKAVSPVGAAGVWQLMPDTARGYGLRVDDTVDERFDIRKSTVVAARFLRDQRRSLDNWPLAIMAYNCGGAAVRRHVFSIGSSDPWTVRERVPRETQLYLPSVLAVGYLLRYREGIEKRKWQPVATRTVTCERELDFAMVETLAGIPAGSLAKVNPHLVRQVAPAGYPFEVPAAVYEKFTSEMAKGTF